MIRSRRTSASVYSRRPPSDSSEGIRMPRVSYNIILHGSHRDAAQLSQLACGIF